MITSPYGGLAMLWVWVVAGLLVAFTAGLLVGRWVANGEWVAIANGSIAHYCRGEHYCVLKRESIARQYEQAMMAPPTPALSPSLKWKEGDAN